MNITIIGAGNMGRGIGYRAVAGGHSVTIVNDHPEKAEKLAAELSGVAKKGATAKTATLEAAFGDVVVLALPFGTALQVAKQLGSRLAGKVVVDISNPLNATYDGLAIEPTT